MRKSRFSETHIIRVLNEVESGKSVKDVCRVHGIRDAHVLQLASKVRWYGALSDQATQGA